tara:strand:- start:5288 stop:6196 length:909 start_codon:yes stop_codon:yes gene_type:complete
MQQILVGQVTAPIQSYSPVLDRINRAYVRVRTPSQSMPEVWSNASLETFANAVLQVAASEGQTFVDIGSLAAPTAIRGNDYYILDRDSGEKFVVTFMAYSIVSAGIYRLHLKDPLPTTVADSSILSSFSVHYDLPVAAVANAGSSIARWKVDIRVGAEVVEHVWDQPFLITYAETNYTLTSASLVRMYPIVDRMRSPTDEDLTELIETGWTNYLRADLENKGMRANQIKSWDRLEACHAAACVYHLILTDERQDPIFRQTWHTEYAHQFDLVLGSREFWYAETDGNTPTRSSYDYRSRTIMR